MSSPVASQTFRTRAATSHTRAVSSPARTSTPLESTPTGLPLMRATRTGDISQWGFKFPNRQHYMKVWT